MVTQDGEIVNQRFSIFQAQPSLPILLGAGNLKVRLVYGVTDESLGQLPLMGRTCHVDMATPKA